MRCGAERHRGHPPASERPGDQRPDDLDLAVVVDEQATELGEEGAAADRPGQQRRFGEGVGLDRGVSECGGPDQSGPGGLARGRIDQVVPEATVVCLPDPDVQARGSDPAEPQFERVDLLPGFT